MKINKAPMGWNTWNTFGENINEDLIKETADMLVSTGLRDLGYNYLVIDDCWSLKERDKDGRLQVDTEKFPNGMKAVADYVHSLGLKFGMYSCCGTLTCAGYPGSYDYEFIDAETFASWDIDFLKYDHCYKPNNAPSDLLYKKMGIALQNTGRDILYSACSWGVNETHKWIKSTGADIWRTTPDIFDSWESISDLYNKNKAILGYNSKGCFGDMDMLVVGMNGKGNVGLGGCTKEEYRTHFSIWAMLNSPLMIGCDIRCMDDDTKEILMNKDVIAINQDEKCAQPYEYGTDVWVKHLSNGDIAVGFFNLGEGKREIPLLFWDIGLPYASGVALSLYDCWEHKELGTFTERFAPTIEPHDCLVVRAKVVER
jgi:alpha-galactosidase